jgi:glyoxylase-like metal-dependent hydrolase (beta-lactamase superfamily II)
VLRIVRVLAPNPGPFTLEGTNTWIVGADPAVVVDPGPDDEDHVRAVLREAGSVGAVLVTHGHPDHAPAAGRLGALAGAPVMAFRPGEGQRRLHDEQLVSVGGVHLRVLFTPGHTADHVVFLAEGTGAMFTGDSVLGRGTTIIDPSEGNLAQYLQSLRRMREARPRVIYPGHGPTVFDAVGKIREYEAHRAEREEQVLAALASGARAAADMVPEIYADVPSELHPLAARQVLAQLLKLEHEGKVARFGSGDDARFERATDRPCERCGRPAMARSRLCRRCSLDALQETPSA